MNFAESLSVYVIGIYAGTLRLKAVGLPRAEIFRLRPNRPPTHSVHTFKLISGVCGEIFSKCYFLWVSGLKECEEI